MSWLKWLFGQKIFPWVLWDGLSVFAAFLLALSFRFDGAIPESYLQSFIASIPFIILLYGGLNIVFGLYRHLWRYTGAQQVVTIAGSTAAGTSFLLLAMMSNNLGEGERPIPLSVVILGGLLTTVAFTLIRYRQRLLTGVMARLERMVGSPTRQRILIVGAGEAGQSLARQIQGSTQRHRYELVGFVDDDPDKWRLRVHNVPVLGNRHTISRLATERSVTLIIIAIHQIAGPDLREILDICLKTPARVKILPDFFRSMDDLYETLPLKDITPEDLLGRQPHQIDEDACRELIADKVILVTGAAGSIGSELCRQILSFHPRQLLMVDNNETGLYDLTITLQYYSNSDYRVKKKNQENIKNIEGCYPVDYKVQWDQYIKNIMPIVANVGNQPKMEHVFNSYRPQIVFHAAAYKHVPLMEEQPDEGIQVNVLGTMTVAKLAARCAVERFVLISTDKAVNPSSIMGATKRLGEMIVTSLAAANSQPFKTNGKQRLSGSEVKGRSLDRIEENEWDREYGRQQTLFTAVRFGNVLGSRGSVVPTFTRQIELGGPVTITHPEMKRYFMSISEAVSLVIQAATLTTGGDIFMLDMGQEIRIADLAYKMIRLRGLRPGQDIPIEYIGVRPGEKLQELLVASDEQQGATTHPKIFRILHNNNSISNSNLLADQISALVELAAAGQTDKMIELLWQLVAAVPEKQTPDDLPGSSVSRPHPSINRQDSGENKPWN